MRRMFSSSHSPTDFVEKGDFRRTVVSLWLPVQYGGNQSECAVLSQPYIKKCFWKEKYLLRCHVVSLCGHIISARLLRWPCTEISTISWSAPYRIILGQTILQVSNT
jgi:hypothetical protein